MNEVLRLIAQSNPVVNLFAATFGLFGSLSKRARAKKKRRLDARRAAALSVPGALEAALQLGEARARLPAGTLSALPAPATPFPTPAPAPSGNPFGIPDIFGGTAANDPIFRRESVFRRFGGRVLGPGSVVILAAEMIAKEIERRQREEMDEIIDRQDEDREARSRRNSRESEIILIETGRSPRPGTVSTSPVEIPVRFPVEFPDVSPRPSDMPQSVPRRAVPFPDATPAIDVEPVEIPNPVPTPAKSSQPKPATVGSTASSRLPNPLSGTFFPNPFLFPVGDLFPRLTAPQTANVTSPKGNIELRPINFGDPAYQQETNKCRPRRCEDDLEEPRNECFKGLYREGLQDTEFNQWVEIDCLTGREKKRRKSNIVEFPRR